MAVLHSTAKISDTPPNVAMSVHAARTRHALLDRLGEHPYNSPNRLRRLYAGTRIASSRNARSSHPQSGLARPAAWLRCLAAYRANHGPGPYHRTGRPLSCVVPLGTPGPDRIRM